MRVSKLHKNKGTLSHGNALALSAMPLPCSVPTCVMASVCARTRCYQPCLSSSARCGHTRVIASEGTRVAALMMAPTILQQICSSSFCANLSESRLYACANKSMRVCRLLLLAHQAFPSLLSCAPSPSLLSRAPSTVVNVPQKMSMSKFRYTFSRAFLCTRTASRASVPFITVLPHPIYPTLALALLPLCLPPPLRSDDYLHSQPHKQYGRLGSRSVLSRV